jgi:hypothetical protein
MIDPLFRTRFQVGRAINVWVWVPYFLRSAVFMVIRGIRGEKGYRSRVTM